MAGLGSAPDTSHAASGADAGGQVPLGATNLGFQLLTRQGWTPGTGLGRDSTGRVEPVSGYDDEQGLRLGLGRREEEHRFTAAENVTRKLLEAEQQAVESEQQRAQRLEKAERDAFVAFNRRQVASPYYCALCEKQYKTHGEMDNHLASYDHHHRKRMLELREDTREGREALLKREAKREAAELESRRAAMEAAEQQKLAAAAGQADVETAGAAPSALCRGRLAFSLPAGAGHALAKRPFANAFAVDDDSDE